MNIAEIPDLNGLGISVYTTFFSPSDVVDPGVSWAQINLMKEEINTLVRSAPAELKTIFNTREEDDGIEKISLEYNKVVVMRPWYKP